MTNSDIPERRRWEVVKRTTNPDIIGVKTSDGKHSFRFQRGRVFYVEDEGIARDIHDTHGQGGSNIVTVIPIEKKARGRRRTWVVPALPWKKEK